MQQAFKGFRAEINFITSGNFPGNAWKASSGKSFGERLREYFME